MSTTQLHKDPIVALATPPGRGAIGIVRLSGGEEICAIARSLSGPLPLPRHATLKTLRDLNGVAFDQALVIYFPAPHSYTGEHMVEIQTHGGTAVVNLVLKTCLAAGARLARAGEFSERAFLNGKLDLVQAEAVADLIAAGSERAARSAYNAMRGRFSEAVNQISADLRRVRTEIEAYIDFPEEDIPALSIESWRQALNEARESLHQVIATARHGAKLNSGIDIAIIGSPNVGKSTLLNAFAGDEKAITSDLPGTTRDIVSVDIEFEGLNLRFHDTAGLRNQPSDKVEQEGIKRTREIISNVDLCLLIRTFKDQEDDAENSLNEISELSNLTRSQLITIWNKIDLHAVEAKIDVSDRGTECFVSAKTGRGVGELLMYIVKSLGLAAEGESPYIARERHVKDLVEALDLLDFDINRVDSEPELLAENLRQAQQVLGEIVGEYTNEDLLGDIFSTFCIGK